MKFTIEIKTGNDACQSETEVLEIIKGYLDDCYDYAANGIELPDTRPLYDENGNKVGMAIYTA